MSLIITLFVYILIFWCIWWLVTRLPIGYEAQKIIRVIVIIIAILVLLNLVGVLPGSYFPRF